MPTKKAVEDLVEVVEQTLEPTQEMSLQEALKKIDELQKKNAELEDKYRELRGQGAGWLIKTPNAAYDGVYKGISFVSGLAFVRDSGSYPQFRPEPLKETQVIALKPEARQAYEEQIKQPDSYFLLREIRSDFPEYQFQHYSEDDLAALDSEFNARRSERVIAEQEIAAAENVKKISVNMRSRS